MGLELGVNFKNIKVVLSQVPIAKNTADILTKALTREAFMKQSNGMGITKFTSLGTTEV